MPDKIMTEFIDPQWINEIRDKHISYEKLAEIIDLKSTVSVSNLLNQKNNPSPKNRNKMSEEFGITFDSIGVRDLILMLTHISDKELSSNCKRVILLCLLYNGKAPGAKIEVAKLKNEGNKYGYGEKEIDKSINKLVKKGLLEQNKDRVNLVFDGFKKLYDKYQTSINGNKEEKNKKIKFFRLY